MNLNNKVYLVEITKRYVVPVAASSEEEAIQIGHDYYEDEVSFDEGEVTQITSLDELPDHILGNVLPYVNRVSRLTIAQILELQAKAKN